MYDHLFSKIKLRGLELKNRVILPSMGTKMCGLDGREVTDKLIDYHVARVRGGCAMNIVEVTAVHDKSSPLGFLSISDDKYIDGFRRLTDAIHAAGGTACLMLWQGGLAVSRYKEAKVYSPSPMKAGDFRSAEMTKAEILEIEDAYCAAAERAVRAGFDSLEFHAAHSYLPHCFLSGGINRRQDEYGGSLENRMRFPLETLAKIRGVMPEEMPLLMRVNAHDDCIDNGLSIEDIIEFCRRAGEVGVDVLDISRGNFLTSALKYEVPSIEIPRGFNIGNAARIKAETGLPTIGVGRINTPTLAEDCIASGQVDMVALGRAQIADPDFCVKAKAGRAKDIICCIGCNLGCKGGFADPNMPHITCTLNPKVGRERECDEMPKAKTPLTVLIAGGGITGLEAAIRLKERGHRPIICEAAHSTGGQLAMAGAPIRKREMRDAAKALERKALHMGVEIRRDSRVTPELIAELRPHTLINATGALPVVPDVPGADAKNIFDYADVLTNVAELTGSVAVIGGGIVSRDTAEFLTAGGCDVTKISGICGVALSPIDDEGKMAVGVTVLEKKTGQEVFVSCGNVVFAGGRVSPDAQAMKDACLKYGTAYFVAGDASKPRTLLTATSEAFDVANYFDLPWVHAHAMRADWAPIN